MQALLLSLSAAIVFSLGDFIGGFASRKLSSIAITFLAQLTGLVVVVGAVWLVPGVRSEEALFWGAVAGLSGAIGLLLYFRALSIASMGVTAPVSALVGAVLPLGAGFSAGERPDPIALGGICLGVAGVVLASQSASEPGGEGRAVERRGMVTAAMAGVLFGLFFVALDGAPNDSGLWPLLAARVAGVGVLCLVLLGARPSFGDSKSVLLGVASGAFDMAANILFLFATRVGMLTLTSVVANLYPAGVVLLAWLFLRERLLLVQKVGVALAVLATVLIAL